MHAYARTSVFVEVELDEVLEGERLASDGMALMLHHKWHHVHYIVHRALLKHMIILCE